MINSNEFKTGMTIEYKDNIYTIIEFQHVKSANSMAFVRTKLKNMRTGTITEFSFNNGEKMKRAMIEKKKMNYLYNAGTTFAFMDMETYEQIDIPTERLEYEKQFLVEGSSVIVVMFEGEILGVNIPEKLALDVKECPPGVKGNTAANATKEAILETGYKIQVPLFIEAGDKIIINTVEGKYYSRA